MVMCSYLKRASPQELNDTALPKLYAQLYELRRAGELLKSARTASFGASAPSFPLLLGCLTATFDVVGLVSTGSLLPER